MNILEVLQTLGICVGSIALAVIAYMLFVFLTPLLPPTPNELAEMEAEESGLESIMEDDDYVVVIPKKGNRQSKRRKR